MERYLFVSPTCPKCRIVEAKMKEAKVKEVEIKDVSKRDDLALAAYLEVGMSVPVLYDDGKILVGPDAIIQQLGI